MSFYLSLLSKKDFSENPGASLPVILNVDAKYFNPNDGSYHYMKSNSYLRVAEKLDYSGK